MSAINQLLDLARAYGDAENIELSTVSSRVFDDSKKLGALQTGRDIQVKRLESALRWFSDHWPENVAWPEGIPRPAASMDEPAQAQG